MQRDSDIIPGKTCVNCSNPIPWRPGIKVRARAKYCSEQCRRSKSDFIPGKSCLECGEPVPWVEGRSIRERTVFCGNPCKYIYQKRHPSHPRIERAVQPCGWCGKPVEFLPSQRTARQLKGVSGTVYCDRICKGKAHSRLMTGRRPNQGVYSSPPSFRQMIRRDFYDRCAICSWDTTPCDVAHIIARKDGGTDTLDNVTMLCPNHHRAFDMGLISTEAVQRARKTILKH